MSDKDFFTFEIVSPERVVLKSRVSRVTVPTVSGEITILPHHIPLVSILAPGVVEAETENGDIEIMSVSGGLVEVVLGKVVILADTAERADELDEELIAQAKSEAEKLKERIRQGDDVDFAALSAKLEKALARERSLKRWRNLPK
ncbi:MAG: ATP synthase F1 subunit epsilon [Patescibacteria group bacterium]|nr:MAG: ATP synthase F1 subunit epsilon [Patescibacteria group bacterium]